MLNCVKRSLNHTQGPCPKPFAANASKISSDRGHGVRERQNLSRNAYERRSCRYLGKYVDSTFIRPQGSSGRSDARELCRSAGAAGWQCASQVAEELAPEQLARDTRLTRHEYSCIGCPDHFECGGQLLTGEIESAEFVGQRLTAKGTPILTRSHAWTVRRRPPGNPNMRRQFSNGSLLERRLRSDSGRCAQNISKRRETFLRHR
jgi:hypothetical protein